MTCCKEVARKGWGFYRQGPKGVLKGSQVLTPNASPSKAKPQGVGPANYFDNKAKNVEKHVESDLSNKNHVILLLLLALEKFPTFKT